MIQSFSIVFAGYKMPACLRQGLSSSSPLPGTCVGVWVSGLSPSLAQSDITLSITLSPISSPLSLLTRHQAWEGWLGGAPCCRIGIIPSIASHELGITGESNTCCQPGRDGWLQARNKCQTDFFNPFSHVLWLTPWWGWAWESLYPPSVSAAGMKLWQWGIFLSNPFKVTIHLIWS